MGNKILTIDLKNRTYGESIILDVASVESNHSLTLDLDFKGAMVNIKNNIRDGYIGESEEALKGIATFFETHKEHELYNEYYALKMVSNYMLIIIDNFKSKIGLEEYLNLREACNYLSEFKNNNDISYFEYTYNNVLNKVQELLNESNLMDIIKKLKESIINTENISYTSYIVNRIKNSDICGEEEEKLLNEFKELQEELEEFRKVTLDKYNKKLGTISNIKALLPYEYREILKDNNFKIYTNVLDKSYDKYDSLKKDFDVIYKLFKLNNSDTYHSFYRNLMNLSLGCFHDLNDYYREYVVRKIFDKDKKYYTMDSLINVVKEIIDTLSMKESANILHV